METAARHFTAYLTAPDPYLRGLSTWAAGYLKASLLKDAIAALTCDASTIMIFSDYQLTGRSVSDLALKALAQIANA